MTIASDRTITRRTPMQRQANRPHRHQAIVVATHTSIHLAAKKSFSSKKVARPSTRADMPA
eukprot:383687-Prymnesium_polylepis.2